MRHFWLSVLFFFLTAVPLADFATPVIPWDDTKVKHTWNAVPVNWETLGHPPAGTTIDLYIALQPDRESALTDALDEISNPRHSRYGQHLLKEQVAELVRPHPDTLKLVGAWLAHHGIRSSSISATQCGDWLTVTGVHVSQANQLLDASHQLYRNIKTNETIIRTVSYALPEVLHTHIQAVAPTTNFASMRVAHQTVQTPRRHSFGAAPAQTQAAPEKLVTSRFLFIREIIPSVLRELYKIYGYTAAATNRNTLAVAALHENPSQADLNKFIADADVNSEGASFTVEQVNGGGNDPASPGMLANASIQYAGAMGYPTPLIFYSVGTYPSGDPFIGFLHYLRDLPIVPQTISLILGIGDELNVSPGYAVSVCLLFAQVGARGVSVLVGSGLSGVGDGNCIKFVPEFPASCPYVTTVGGTTNAREVAADLSGGGFSRYFRRPPYQESVVPGYLDYLGDKYEGLYNPTGRGFPDIAAQLLKFIVVHQNVELDAPACMACTVSAVAGIISMLNDYLISKRKPPLGFLNGFLYGDALEGQGFNDVTSGSNPGCHTKGFNATAGWDPVTGLGTLNFEKLLDVLRQTRKID